MSAQATAGEMEKELALRCHELKELASKVRNHLRADLRNLEKEHAVYRFYDRLKEPQLTLNKVVRARSEAASAAAETQRKLFQPEDVTDAWGCRFVTPLPSETIEVMAAVFRQIEAWSRNEWLSCKVSIEAVTIYTNRPDNDPLSIAPKAKQLVETHALLFRGTDTEARIVPRWQLRLGRLRLFEVAGNEVGNLLSRTIAAAIIGISLWFAPYPWHPVTIAIAGFIWYVGNTTRRPDYGFDMGRIVAQGFQETWETFSKLGYYDKIAQEYGDCKNQIRTTLVKDVFGTGSLSGQRQSRSGD